MTIFVMLEPSAILTVLGMAVVFSFLWIMVICVNLTSKLIGKKSDEKDAINEGDPASLASSPGHIAAISAAVSEYQKDE